MIFCIPLDVERYILNFIINGFTIKNVSKVCKRWEKLVSESEYKLKALKLYNKTGILLEDNLLRLENDYIDLAKRWENF